HQHTARPPRDDRLDAGEVRAAGNTFPADVDVGDVQDGADSALLDAHALVEQAAAGELEDARFDPPVDQQVAGMMAAGAVAGPLPLLADPYTRRRAAADHQAHRLENARHHVGRGRLAEAAGDGAGRNPAVAAGRQQRADDRLDHVAVGLADPVRPYVGEGI